jgi:hypothetical protein
VRRGLILSGRGNVARAPSSGWPPPDARHLKIEKTDHRHRLLLRNAWQSYRGAKRRNEAKTDLPVAIGERRAPIAVTGDRAYVVVVSATSTYKQKGKPVTQSGSVWTCALQKLAGGWRIAAWAWSDKSKTDYK